MPRHAQHILLEDSVFNQQNVTFQNYVVTQLLSLIRYSM
jgi:hypothetical protein